MSNLLGSGNTFQQWILSLYSLIKIILHNHRPYLHFSQHINILCTKTLLNSTKLIIIVHWAFSQTSPWNTPSIKYCDVIIVWCKLPCDHVIPGKERQINSPTALCSLTLSVPLCMCVTTRIQWNIKYVFALHLQHDIWPVLRFKFTRRFADAAEILSFPP